MPSYSCLLGAHRADSAQEHSAASTGHLRKIMIKLKSRKLKAFDLEENTGGQFETALHCKRRKVRRWELCSTVVVGTESSVVAGRSGAPTVVMGVPVVGNYGVLAVVRLRICVMAVDNIGVGVVVGVVVGVGSCNGVGGGCCV